ncbi:polysaccharide biosynthesis/export family protein [Erythrobacter mangrovi]|uniref:Polysaccharide biosynthesis/export family protein n=1 Tax=Erythrobacter mangrovi TaxID=2739433 RepID=A0A7D3XSB8_9SPHN|nr:polysaccharide biosynthesis/export family protein [Erythrobacter mangrovi]QKG72454.1 polysaccharide biosynthesis/export family protein [Erythrobacter mangrovi]
MTVHRGRITAGRRLAFSVVLAPVCLGLAACQPGTDSIVPAGDAGYAAIALPQGDGMPERYLLQPGDVVSVQVYGEQELSVAEVSLDNAGMLNLPLIGGVRASGLTADELSESIEAVYAAEYVRDPRVAVLVKKTQLRTIAVEGEVALPGVYPYAEGQTLLTALALARSTTEKAKLDEVMIFRTIDDQRMAGRFDIRAIRGGRMPDVTLLPGDIVVVGFSGSRGAFLDALRAIPAIGIFRPWP